MDPDYHTPIRLERIDSPLKRELKELFSIDVDTCLECGKCSGGCSNAHVFDYTPRKIVQLVKLGAEETLLKMDALWICLSCQICLDRCPSGIDIPRILDHLREKARRKGIPASRPAVGLFHELMLGQIRKTGRISEIGLMLRFAAATGRYGKDAGLGIRMFLKGKLNPISAAVKKVKEVRRLYDHTADGKKA
ncbi:MAG TPA: 4Fe-4S dicluster domain-containing protein [Syntrophales bacterium]|nr:4Fe-4S dicluster domain-containing protein [Syntrophales bacterium]